MVVAIAQHVGMKSSPIEITLAATIPVVAASMAPPESPRRQRAAANQPEKSADGVQQVFSHAAALQHQAHEGEEQEPPAGCRYSSPPDAVGHGVEQRGLQQAQSMPAGQKHNAVGSQGKRHRIAQQQKITIEANITGARFPN